MDIHIDDFYSTADGDDWLPAFERAQQLHGIAQSGYSTFGGFTLKFRARAYYFSAALQIVSPMSLIGSGGVANPGTILMFPKGSKGLIFHGYGTNMHPKYGGPVSETPGKAQGSTVEKLMVMAVDPSDRRTPAPTHAMTDFRESLLTPNPGAHGIFACTMIALRDVTVVHFDGHGIYLYGNGDDDAESPGTSSIAAFCQLTNVYVSENGGDGLHLFGNDCSGCVVQSSQFVHNAGWGIQDLNYLGQTTVIGGQCAYNVSGGVSRPYEVTNRDYGTLQAQLNFAISDPTASTENKAKWTALAAAVPAAVGAAAASPDVAGSPLLLDSLQSGLGDVAYWNAYREYMDAWGTHWKAVGDGLRDALIAAGFADEPAITHLDFGNPYGAGGDVFINVYAESNGTGSGERNILGVTNLAINSLISSGTDALGWNAAGFRNNFIGAGGLSADVLETDRLALRNGATAGTLSASATAPFFAAVPGTWVLNSEPVPGGHLGWVSVKVGGTTEWREFGAISA
jgi:hypothetical protein